jgi:hypothetical protein
MGVNSELTTGVSSDLTMGVSSELTKCGPLAELRYYVLRNVTSWWREDWPDLPATFPIHDFFLATDMVAESIR